MRAHRGLVLGLLALGSVNAALRGPRYVPTPDLGMKTPSTGADTPRLLTNGVPLVQPVAVWQRPVAMEAPSLSQRDREEKLFRELAGLYWASSEEKQEKVLSEVVQSGMNAEKTAAILQDFLRFRPIEPFSAGERVMITSKALIERFAVRTAIRFLTVKRAEVTDDGKTWVITHELGEVPVPTNHITRYFSKGDTVMTTNAKVAKELQWMGKENRLTVNELGFYKVSDEMHVDFEDLPFRISARDLVRVGDVHNAMEHDQTMDVGDVHNAMEHDQTMADDRFPSCGPFLPIVVGDVHNPVEHDENIDELGAKIASFEKTWNAPNE